MLELDFVQTLAFAGVALLLGEGLRRLVPVLSRYNLPAPVLGGLLVAVAVLLARGQGVTLQRYRDGGLSDVIAFRLTDGLSWALGGESGRTRTETDLTPWRAARGAAGRMPPIGFPRSNKFG